MFRAITTQGFEKLAIPAKLFGKALNHHHISCSIRVAVQLQMGLELRNDRCARGAGKLRLFYDTETARGSTALEWEKGGPRLIYDPQDSGRVATTVVTLSTELRDAIVVCKLWSSLL